MNLKVYLLVSAIVCFRLPATFAEDDHDFDYSDGSDEVSHEHNGVEDVLKNMYQHMVRFDQRLTMLENKLTSFKREKAQQMKMALTPKTPGECLILMYYLYSKKIMNYFMDLSFSG